MKSTYSAFIALITFVFIFQSCETDKTTDADIQLFNELSASGYTYYQSGFILSAAGNSPHGSFQLRFNDIAQTALDSLGELPPSGSFPNGSIIVKEIKAQNQGSTTLYAVMKKDPSNVNANNGWVWAEYDPDGSTVISLSTQGSSCVGCHSQTPNRDFTRTFDLH